MIGLDRLMDIKGVVGAGQFAQDGKVIRTVGELPEDVMETADLCVRQNQIAEELIKFTLREVDKRCKKELEILNYNLPECPSKFKMVTYDECLEILKNRNIELRWGEDLGTEELRVLGEEIKTFYFIYDWPREAKPFYIKIKEDNPELTESFDLMFSDLELASGGTRINSRKELTERLIEQGLDVESFKEHLKFFDYGMPPHSGFGLGLDRLMLVLTGKKNLREVTLYPRDPERITP